MSMVSKCEYCSKTSEFHKIIKTSRFGEELLLCNTHYYQMVRTGKVERTYKWKNNIVEHDSFLEIILYDKNNNAYYENCP